MVRFKWCFLLRMQQWLCPALLILLACLPITTLLASPVPKPQSPLTLRIDPAIEPVIGQAVDFQVSLQSQVDTNAVTLTVSLPTGSVLNSGSLTWQGALSRGAVQVLSFRATIPRTSHMPIVATAQTGQAGQSQFSTRAIYETQPTESITAVSIGDKPRVVERDGSRVDEYVLQ